MPIPNFLKSLNFTYLLNQSIAEDAEQENLSEGIQQISDYAECENCEAVNLRRLIRQESQHDGGCQHVKEQCQSVGLTNRRNESGLKIETK